MRVGKRSKVVQDLGEWFVTSILNISLDMTIIPKAACLRPFSMPCRDLLLYPQQFAHATWVHILAKKFKVQNLRASNNEGINIALSICCQRFYPLSC